MGMAVFYRASIWWNSGLLISLRNSEDCALAPKEAVIAI